MWGQISLDPKLKIDWSRSAKTLHFSGSQMTWVLLTKEPLWKGTWWRHFQLFAAFWRVLISFAFPLFWGACERHTCWETNTSSVGLKLKPPLHFQLRLHLPVSQKNYVFTSGPTKTSNSPKRSLQKRRNSNQPDPNRQKLIMSRPTMIPDRFDRSVNLLFVFIT